MSYVGKLQIEVGAFTSAPATPPGIVFTIQQHAAIAKWARVHAMHTQVDVGQEDCEEVIWIFGEPRRQPEFALYRDGDNGSFVVLHAGREVIWGELDHVLDILSGWMVYDESAA